jgi:hypothetical protein
VIPAFRSAALAAIAVALGAAGAALAQDMPQVRDSRTGRVWTPEPVTVETPGDASRSPSSYANRAFDPNAQNVQVPGVVVQHPRAQLMGTVPITAGPAMPVVTLDVPSLQVVPARHWLSILYVTNNSANTVNAVVGCHFINGGRKVEDVRVIVPSAGPGERLGLPVRGPRYDVFVDRVSCDVISPT